MASLFQPNLSGEVLKGYVHLLLSLYFPPENGEPNVPTDGGFKADFLRWISSEFICGSGFSSFSVELVSTLQMESDCGNGVDWQSSPPSILWNAPTATIDVGEDEFYATWNVTYPIYDWGESANLQQDIQEALEYEITNGELDAPWQGAAISVVGAENATFGLPVIININDGKSNINDSKSTSPGLMREEMLSVDEVSATAMQFVGGMMLVLQTALLLVSFIFGSWYSEKQREPRAEKAKSLLDAKGLDDMLLLSKGHNVAEQSSPDLMLETPYTTSANPVKQLSSPTRSLVSNLSVISSAKYVGDSLFPSMVSDIEDDEVSEAGTEVIIASICSGSNHSISSAVLDAESRANKSLVSDDDDRSMSQSSIASVGSRKSIAVPGTILGKSTDDDDADDAMLFD